MALVLHGSRLRPAASIEARHTVGLVDAITASELTERVNDGLPETLEQVLQAYGHRYFKLKVLAGMRGLRQWRDAGFQGHDGPVVAPP